MPAAVAALAALYNISDWPTAGSSISDLPMTTPGSQGRHRQQPIVDLSGAEPEFPVPPSAPKRRKQPPPHGTSGSRVPNAGTFDQDVVMRLSTSHSSRMRTIFEAIQKMVNEANLHFVGPGHEELPQGGMILQAMDCSHIAVVKLTLDARQVKENGSYYCKPGGTPIKIGLDITSFGKILRAIDGNLVIEVLESQRDKLVISSHNEQSGECKQFIMTTLDIKEESLELPPMEFDAVITMLSEKFQRSVRDLLLVSSDVMRIESRTDELVLCGKVSDSSAAATTEAMISIPMIDSVMVVEKMSDEESAVAHEFPIRYMEIISKAAAVATKLRIYMKREYFPVVMEYELDSLGKLMFGVAPKMPEGE